MSVYLTNEAIAQALKLTPQAVEDILEGRAEVTIQQPESTLNEVGPVIHVNSFRTSYRQKIISVVRTKGGVGATVIGVGLAYLLSREIKTLLVEIVPGKGAGDLACYLSFEKYASLWPETSVFARYIDISEICIDPKLDALVLNDTNAKNLDIIRAAVNIARQNYDAVLIDIPNRTEEPYVAEAIEQSNSIVAVTGGLETEVFRLVCLVNSFSQKDIVIVANRCVIPVFEGLERYKTIRVNHDPSLEKVFQRSDLPSLKSPFMRDVMEVKEVLYGEQQKGFFKSLFKDERK